jgi:hypothetical protein
MTSPGVIVSIGTTIGRALLGVMRSCGSVLRPRWLKLRTVSKSRASTREFVLYTTITIFRIEGSWAAAHPGPLRRMAPVERQELAGIVPAPSFFILASHDVWTLSSRSVAVMVSVLPFASTRRFERMGIVVLRTCCDCNRNDSFCPGVSSSCHRKFLLQLLLLVHRCVASLTTHTLP